MSELFLSGELAVKLLLAVALGGIIGFERELRSKSAGFRTLILICVGATLFTIFSQILGAKTSPDRIASNVVVGIGFLGAGVIFRGDFSKANGITTAASIWTTAAVGVGIGCGYYMASIAACVLIFVVLSLFSLFDPYIDRINQVRAYKIMYSYEVNGQQKYERLIQQYKLKIKNRAQSKIGDKIVDFWTVQGSERNHHAFIEQVLADDKVTEFDF